tara:strand:+ start:2171 stop:2641 length:471 start_codon:yes stop_codon:yes gene_type:complete
MNLDIDKEANAAFFEIIEKEHGDLMDRWNDLNARILKIQIPKIFLFTIKSNLREIGQELKQLQNDYIAWNKKAGNFLGKPNYTFKESQNGLAVLTHYSSMLRHVVNSMHNNMILIANNYNKRWDQYKGQTNFVIAISSFLLTFLGLIAALYTILLS